MNTYVKKQIFWWKKISIKVVALILILLFLNVFGNQARNFIYLASYPISKIFLQYGDNINNFFSDFLKARKLNEENINLKREKQDLLLQISLLEDKLKEEYDLKSALQITKNDGFKIFLTKVIGLNLENDTIIIDKGADDGVLESMPLISGEKVIYGRVLKVYKNFSQVLLISAHNNTLNVKIQSYDPVKNTVYGVLKGQGNQSVYLDLVDFESGIKEEDVLVTSGLEGVLPSNLLVGQIISVDKSDLKPFQTAKVRPFFSLKNIKNLFLITNYKK
ncbi:MAG: rod shape-determining protein MreC [Patescibacteria group bacterium]